MSDERAVSRVRLSIFERFLKDAQAPTVEELMTQHSLLREGVTGILDELVAARHIALVPGSARILMAFPFSAIATPFSVMARGQRYFANCAWDAVAFHAMLGDDVRVESFCHHCASPISIELRDGRATHVEPKETLVYLALRPTQWWENIVTTCSNTMVFFASPEHRDASDLCAPPEQAASLTPDEVHALSGPIYARKLELDYARPTREELLDHFAAIGLTGSYWRI
ncbi:MAG: alkylmercury lyase family protein [Chloroflexota bacterium]|nr:alkylmercury lyase family protein [Chloroflexota bacterium]